MIAESVETETMAVARPTTPVRLFNPVRLFVPPTRLLPPRVFVVGDDVEGRVPTRQFPTGWPAGGADNFCPQAVFCFPKLIVQFKFDPKTWFRSLDESI